MVCSVKKIVRNFVVTDVILLGAFIFLQETRQRQRAKRNRPNGTHEHSHPGLI
jgi:hypothetical protein